MMSGRNPDTRQQPGQPWRPTTDNLPDTDWTPEEHAETGRPRTFSMSATRLVHSGTDAECLDRTWCTLGHQWYVFCSCGASFRHARKGPVKTWRIEHGVEHDGFGESAW